MDRVWDTSKHTPRPLVNGHLLVKIIRGHEVNESQNGNFGLRRCDTCFRSYFHKGLENNRKTLIEQTSSEKKMKIKEMPKLHGIALIVVPFDIQNCKTKSFLNVSTCNFVTYSSTSVL